MKHVWMLNHYALEPGGAGGTRHYNLAEHLLAHGWRASVLAASVELNSGRQRLASNEKYRLQVFGRVPFLFVRTPQYKGNGGGRMLNMLCYAWRVWLPATTRSLDKPDAVIGSSVHPFAALAGALLARRHHVPFIFEVRDLWPQTLIDLGRLREGSLVAVIMRRLERWLYRRATRIVVLLPRAVDYIAPLGIPAERIVWIPNGVNISGFPAPAPKKHDVGDVFTLMYFGAHGQANGLDNILQAMKLVNQRVGVEAIILRLIGDGPMKAALQEQSVKLGLTNVTFEKPVPKTSIPALAADADAFVFNLIDAPVFKYGISSNKLFDFMAGARPVIFCCTASNNPVEDAQCGLTVKPGDPGALADAIVAVATTTSSQRETWGLRGRHHIEQQYGFDALAGRLVAVLDESLAEAAVAG
jgi:glycosyltransferase involved in cell wall biosynthesis